ncbi:exopolysaccharide biosynthesis protein YbjH [Pacificibacter maritimus]|uniref:Exopolysaccharide biosynthesis protein YbjH n=1 Tax=Pacificibacter maritimus TaxID=762213 RepID=A0A3N4U496_9RHOB|nr:YjbH domain-containing protein [Pacificibacter maritimus]RPE63125.1 exopolysaccharide biosynthesis protein YbjH [Pacificibacter maritimus]
MAACLSITTVLSAASSFAQDLTSTRVNTLGRPGIVEMPSAEMAPDGQLSLSYGRFGNFNRTTLSFQITPRLSGSFRYSGIKDFNDDFDTYWDRSFDISYLIAKEGTYRPAIAIGLQDFLGTGLLSGEYIVATKSVGQKLRVTGGLGWGRLASHSPLGLSFGERSEIDVATGGTPNFDQWFRGDIAAFGGLSYQLNDKLTLMAEYSSDAYSAETERGVFDHKSPVNVAVDYKLGKTTSVTAFYLHGDEVGLQFSASLNPKNPRVSGGLEKAPLPVRPRPSRAADPEGWSDGWVEEVGDASGIRKALSAAMTEEGLTLEAMSLSVTRAEVRFRNDRYNARSQALGRLSRIMTRAFPPSVETFVLTETMEGVPVHSTVVQRSALEAYEFEPARSMLESVTFADPLSFEHDNLVSVREAYPQTLWSIAPYVAVSVFDPDSPVRLDYGIRGQINYELAPGLTLDAAAFARISGNISDEEDDVDDSTLPPVRTSSREYDNRLRVEKLTANWYSRPAENLFGRMTVGYLESMYGGVSGELLWKKPNSSFALGAEVNYAVQRDFEDTFGFGDYDIMTGHLSAYYAFDGGYHGQMDVGRYLAGDWGTTLSLDREFNNGWRVGAYATFTDVPFEDFGEGSFDKGIRITVPSDWFAGTPTTETNDFVIQSLTRDGGAKLNVSGRLYDRVRGMQGDQLEERWGRFWR